MQIVLTREGKRDLEERLRRLDQDVLPALREQLWGVDRDGRIDHALERALDERRRIATALAAHRDAEGLDDDPEVVELGDWVRLRADDGTLETFRIVDPIEAPLDATRISADSPLAKVLLGRREGEEVELSTQVAPIRYTILGADREGPPTAA